MYLRTFKFLVLICALSVANASAQKLTTSPYSRYGLGDISYSGSGHNIALGGTGIAESTSMFLNTLNPAGNSNLMLQRFVFDVGLDVKYTNTSSSSTSQKNNNTTFKYLTGGFAVKPWWFWTFELKPISSVGYTMEDSTYATASDNITDTYGYSETFKGQGGLSKLSISTSFKLFKMLSFGVQGGFIWGNLERYHYLYDSQFSTKKYSTSVYYSNKYIIHGFDYRLGFLAQKSFKSHKDSLKTAFKFAVGGYLGNEAKLNSRNEVLFYQACNYGTSSSTSTNYSSTDTISLDTLYNGKLIIPKSYGIGVSLEFFDKLMVNADYQYQDWSGFSLPGETYANTSLKENKYYGLGFQFVAAKFSSRYYKTINYRLGIHRSDTYLKINGYDVEDRGFTFGLGFPIRSLILNVSCDFGSRGTTEHNLYKEKYWLLHFNVTAHDVWFVKRKFQ